MKYGFYVCTWHQLCKYIDVGSLKRNHPNAWAVRAGDTGKELLEEKKSFRKFNKSNAKQRNNASKGGPTQRVTINDEDLAPWAEQIVEGRRKFMTTKRRNADLAPWAELIANDEDLAPWAEQIVKGTKKSETKLGCSYT